MLAENLGVAQASTLLLSELCQAKSPFKFALLEPSMQIFPDPKNLDPRSALNPAARLWRPSTQMPPSISMRLRLGRWANLLCYMQARPRLKMLRFVATDRPAT